MLRRKHPNRPLRLERLESRDVPAGVLVNQVQHLYAQLNYGSTSVTVELPTPVALDRSLVVGTARTAADWPGNSAARFELVDTDGVAATAEAVKVTRGGDGGNAVSGTLIADLSVVEFFSGAKVEHKLVSLGGSALQADATLTTAAPAARSFVVMSQSSDAATPDLDERWAVRGELVNTGSTLRLKRAEGGSGAAVAAQVVTFDADSGATVQTGTAVFSGGTSATVSYADNPGGELLFFSSSAPGDANGAEGKYRVQGGLSGGVATFSTAQATSLWATYYVVSIPGAAVTSGVASLAAEADESGAVQQGVHYTDVPAPQVDLGNSLAWATASGGPSGRADALGDTLFTARLEATGSLRLERGDRTDTPGWTNASALEVAVSVAYTVVELPMPARVNITPVVSDASEEGPTAATFLVSRTGPTSLPLTVYLNASGAAQFGDDYHLGQSGVLVTIPAGASSAVVTLTPVDDDRPERDETVTLYIEPMTSYAVGANSRATATIHDNDTQAGGPPTVTFDVTDPEASVPDSGDEGEDHGEFTLTRTGDISGELEVQFTVYGTAAEGTDYELEYDHGTGESPEGEPNRVHTVVFRAGEATATVVVRALGGEWDEDKKIGLMPVPAANGAYVSVLLYAADPADPPEKLKRKFDYARPDQYSILLKENEKKPLVIPSEQGVLRNDRLPDGTRPAVTSLKVLVAPKHGNVSDFVLTGGFKYTPTDFDKQPDAAGQSFADSFTYEVIFNDNGILRTRSALVEIWRGQYMEYDKAPATPQPKPTGGFLLGGGGSDANFSEALQQFVKSAKKGDLVVLQAAGGSKGNPANTIWTESTKLPEGDRLNSMKSFMVGQRYAAGSDEEKALVAALDGAEAIYFAGGDQSKYIDWWQDTPIQAAINNAIARQAAIGGSSAGCHIQGGVASKSTQYSSVGSKEILANPYTTVAGDPALKKDFLSISRLNGVLTDTHFGSETRDVNGFRGGRDRMGRVLGFLARMKEDALVAVGTPARAVAVDENTAVWVDAGGQARVYGKKYAYFFSTSAKAEQCQSGMPLKFANVNVYRVSASAAAFTFADAFVPANAPAGGVAYKVSTNETSATTGVLESTKADGKQY